MYNTWKTQLIECNLLIKSTWAVSCKEAAVSFEREERFLWREMTCSGAGRGMEDEVFVDNRLANTLNRQFVVPQKTQITYETHLFRPSPWQAFSSWRITTTNATFLPKLKLFVCFNIFFFFSVCTTPCIYSLKSSLSDVLPSMVCVLPWWVRNFSVRVAQSRISKLHSQDLWHRNNNLINLIFKPWLVI